MFEGYSPLSPRSSSRLPNGKRKTCESHHRKFSKAQPQTSCSLKYIIAQKENCRRLKYLSGWHPAGMYVLKVCVTATGCQENTKFTKWTCDDITYPSASLTPEARGLVHEHKYFRAQPFLHNSSRAVFLPTGYTIIMVQLFSPSYWNIVIQSLWKYGYKPCMQEATWRFQ